ncbi:hypothetical protein [Modestobacter lapidis]|nr:hypothetical protein [Modestobacter lapidis]
MGLAVVVVVIAARFIVPLGIPRRPVPALLAALVLDAVDQTVFQSVGADFDGYQSYDKALDVYYLAIAYASTLRNWPPGLAFTTARFLWYYRLVGVAAFELTGARPLLLVFPNTFEYYFLAYEVIRTGRDPRRLSRRCILALAGGIWVFVKLPQEWWIHIARLDVTEQLADHPQLASWLAAAAAATLAGCTWWLHRGRPRDWPSTTRVDAHLPSVAVGPARAVPLRSRIFLGMVGEKALLVSLVVVIFAQVLPTMEATATQIVLSTSTFITANAVVSQLLARHGTSWTSTLSQFLAMAAVNAGITVTLRLLPGERGASFDVASSLFFLLLLTLLVTFHDRYRTVRRERAALLGPAGHPVSGRHTLPPPSGRR